MLGHFGFLQLAVVQLKFLLCWWCFQVAYYLWFDTLFCEQFKSLAEF